MIPELWFRDKSRRPWMAEDDPDLMSGGHRPRSTMRSATHS